LSIDDLLRIANSPGALLAFVLLMLVAGARGAWVFGRTYDKLEKDRDEWKAAALKALNNTEQLVGHFEKDPRRLERQAP
jgi:positive regulator of sigma E activity